MSVPGSLASMPDVIRVDRGKLKLGRSPKADVRLPHPAISRMHAELRVDAGSLHVRDLGSTGGLLVNGLAVRDSLLRDGDVIAFGPIAYQVEGGRLRLRGYIDGALVEVRDLAIRRGTKQILNNINLTIPANNFIGILGLSGAGKTTLLKALTGYLPIAGGKILLNGTDLADDPEACRVMVGLVPQEDVLYRTLTARETLAYSLRLRATGDLTAGERKTQVEQGLARLNLTHCADRPVHTLSGGERKRVSVGIELLSRPRLLLLDEPTAGLDPASEARLMSFLRDLAHTGTTVICTTHVMESLHLFDAVMVVAGGRLLGSGAPGNLLSHFKAKSFAQLYEVLENPPAPPQNNAPLPKSQPRRNAASVHHARAGGLSQVATQLERGFVLIARDRALLALLIGQPILIGVLIALSQVTPGVGQELNPFYTFAVVAAIWLGLNNTAREVVRDRAVYTRERRAVVNPESYLLAKLLLYGGIGLAQIIVLVLWLRFCNFMPAESHAHRQLAALSLTQFGIVLWLTYLSAMLLGLLISTLAASEEVAVAVLPLVVLPQLILSGVGANLLYERKGFFNTLLHFFAGPKRGELSFGEWVLDAASLLTFSRPALVFFLNFSGDPDPPGLTPFVRGALNWAHLIFLLFLTATVFVAVFYKRERRWLEAA